MIRAMEKEFQYPENAASLDALERLVDECPGWATNKFAAVFEGKQLDYRAAYRLVRERRAAELQPAD